MGHALCRLSLQNTDEQPSIFAKTSSVFFKLLEDFVVPVLEIGFGNSGKSDLAEFCHRCRCGRAFVDALLTVYTNVARRCTSLHG